MSRAHWIPNFQTRNPVYWFSSGPGSEPLPKRCTLSERGSDPDSRKYKISNLKPNPNPLDAVNELQSNSQNVIQNLYEFYIYIYVYIFLLLMLTRVCNIRDLVGAPEGLIPSKMHSAAQQMTVTNSFRSTQQNGLQSAAQVGENTLNKLRDSPVGS